MNGAVEARVATLAILQRAITEARGRDLVAKALPSIDGDGRAESAEIFSAFAKDVAHDLETAIAGLKSRGGDPTAILGQARSVFTVEELAAAGGDTIPTGKEIVELLRGIREDLQGLAGRGMKSILYGKAKRAQGTAPSNGDDLEEDDLEEAGPPESPSIEIPTDPKKLVAFRQKQGISLSEIDRSLGKSVGSTTQLEARIRAGSKQRGRTFLDYRAAIRKLIVAREMNGGLSDG